MKNTRQISIMKGHIFACTNKSEHECLERSLFSTNKIYADKAFSVTKNDFLFLYNLDSDVLYGPFRAKSNGRKDIVPEAWNGKYPYQVLVEKTEKINAIKNCKKILSKMGIKWQENLNEKQTEFLLTYLENTNNFDWEKVKVYLNTVKKNVDNNGKPRLESTTLWDFPRQNYGKNQKGSNKYAGVTPAFIIYNMVKRYTERGETVLDPMAGSGTTLDVCEEEGRKCIAYDIVSVRPDIKQNDARNIPLKDDSIDMIFIDSPYGDNIKYNNHPHNIGKISAESDQFYEELEKVMKECKRVLRAGKVLGWLIGDQWVKKKFTPVGFRIYEKLSEYFEPVDVICVVRRNQTSNSGMWYNRAIKYNFYLRGFKYLIIMKKPLDERVTNTKRQIKWTYYRRQNTKEKKN